MRTIQVNSKAQIAEPRRSNPCDGGARAKVPESPEADRKSTDGKAIVLPSASQMSHAKRRRGTLPRLLLPPCPNSNTKQPTKTKKITKQKKKSAKMCKDYGKTSTKALLTSFNCRVPPDRASSKKSCAVTTTAAATLRRNDSGTSSAAGHRFLRANRHSSASARLNQPSARLSPSATGIPALHSSHPLYPSLNPRYVPKHQGKKRQALPFLVPSESSEPKPFDHSDILTGHPDAM